MKTIVIVGLGLMGGSLAASCRRKFPRSRLIGVSRSRKALNVCLKRRWIHEGTHDLPSAVKDADLVILCTPVDTFPKLLRALDRFAKRGVLVTDVGSVKGELLRWVERRSWRHIRFVGAHPMVGSHERGIEVAEPHLYDHGFTFLIRSKGTSQQSYAAVKNFWKRISPKIVEVKPEQHDKIASEISHLPHAVATCLVLAAQKKSLRFASTGFRDTTRVALGHPSVWLPIFRSNRKAMRHALTHFEKKLRQFRRALAVKDNGPLRRILAAGARRRRQIVL